MKSEVIGIMKEMIRIINELNVEVSVLKNQNNEELWKKWFDNTNSNLEENVDDSIEKKYDNPLSCNCGFCERCYEGNDVWMD